MKIYVNCRTVYTTDRTILQVCVLYNICRKGQEPKTQSWGGYDVLNLFHINLDICTLPYRLRAMVIAKVKGCAYIVNYTGA